MLLALLCSLAMLYIVLLYVFALYLTSDISDLQATFHSVIALDLAEFGSGGSSCAIVSHSLIPIWPFVTDRCHTIFLAQFGSIAQKVSFSPGSMWIINSTYLSFTTAGLE